MIKYPTNVPFFCVYRMKGKDKGGKEERKEKEKIRKIKIDTERKTEIGTKTEKGDTEKM